MDLIYLYWLLSYIRLFITLLYRKFHAQDRRQHREEDPNAWG